MDILFDSVQNKWGHREAGESFVWGQSRKPLPRLLLTPETVLFPVHVRGEKVGPLVGILTSKSGSSFAGNRITFRRVHRALGSRGGILFVFTPAGVRRREFHAFVYQENRHRWVKTQLPYPDVVYNRIPFRKEEERPAVRLLLRRLESRGIPYFNRGFLDKWELYETLRNDPTLSDHLPDTRQASKANLRKMLDIWGAIYVKPQTGQKGDGIFRVTKKMDGTIIYQNHKKTIHCPTFTNLWERVQPIFDRNPYLIQQKIELMHHHCRPYDFRLMLQKVNGRWQGSGCGARLAGKDSITTHIPKGGELLALDQLRSAVDLPTLEAIAIRAAEMLEEWFIPLNELSFDIGRDQDGHYWLFEANAKPMVFDEPEIEQRRMDRLVNTFYEKSGF